jgi:NADH-quinone oxidoreductase subunit N
MSMTVLSMAGIPPLAGYGSKLYIFLAAIESSLYTVAIIAIVSSVIGAVYYIRIVRTIYFDNINTYNIYHTMDIQKALILSLTSLFILFFMACPSLLLIITHEIALNFAL